MEKSAASDFFTPAELERVRLAVAAAESTTSGEIATMVVMRSEQYREARVGAAVLGAATLALIIAVATGHVTIWSYLPLTLILYYPVFLAIGRCPRLVRPFIGRRRLDEAVRERAVRAFYEKGLYRTKHATGILLFISLFERKVWILGDRGINARIPPESWQELAKSLTLGIVEGRACEALCGVIARCGEELTRHFPLKSGDSNELSDDLLTDD